MKPKIEAEVFIKTWCDAAKARMPQSHIARTLGISSAAVSARAKAMRKRGVLLPDLPVLSIPRQNPAALNALVVECMGEGETETETETEVEKTE
jgi:DNA-binding Lrp family transcriptional regulator